MTATFVLSQRTRRELLRDPSNILFALGFPLGVMALLTALQANIPAAVFPIATITPGMAVFGLSFIALFAGMLLARDRDSAFLMRLYASPARPTAFILGYLLPLLPLALAQGAICYLAAFLLGLAPSWNVLAALLTLLPTALLFVSIGLLAGALLSDRQVGGVCGALLTNLTAWLSGTWFDLSLVGETFRRVAYCLPFAHAVDAGRAALDGRWSALPGHLAWVCGYAAVALVAAVVVFRGRMRRV